MCVAGGGRGGAARGSGYATLQTIVLDMKRLNQTESPIFEILCVLCFRVFFVSKDNPFLLLFYSTVAVVMPCGGREKSPHTSS